MNWLLWLGSCLAILGFATSEQMASAYGLAFAVAMLTTTILLYVYLRCRREKPAAAWIVLILFGIPELLFLAANLGKLITGGLVAAILTVILFLAMLSWARSREIEERYSQRMKLTDCIPQLRQLRDASLFPWFTDNLVYVERGEDIETVDKAILWSILENDLKRAKTYWFVSVHIDDKPYTEKYTVETFGTDFVFRVKLDLGFKCTQPVTQYLRSVFRELQEDGVIAPQRRAYVIEEDSAYGAFHYCVLNRVATDNTVFSVADGLAMRVRNLMQRLAGFREEWYAEENTDVSVEDIPLDLDERLSSVRIVRVRDDRLGIL